MTNKYIKMQNWLSRGWIESNKHSSHIETGKLWPGSYGSQEVD